MKMGGRRGFFSENFYLTLSSLLSYSNFPRSYDTLSQNVFTFMKGILLKRRVIGTCEAIKNFWEF
jgi:hypothetical protein